MVPSYVFKQSSLDNPKNVCTSLTSPQAFIPINVEGTNVLAFLDTGADVSIISDKLRMQIPQLKRTPLTPLLVNTLSITGQPMDTLGQIVISIRVGTSTVSHMFQVVRGISKQFLLG